MSRMSYITAAQLKVKNATPLAALLRLGHPFSVGLEVKVVKSKIVVPTKVSFHVR